MPKGCTPLSQVTDTGFAQPAKASAREVHEELREQLEHMARLEGTQVHYIMGAEEILRVCHAMHRRMVSLDSERETVLAEARAAGWLHWRPCRTAGKLVPCSEQAWAAKHAEGSSRMSPFMRENRSAFVQDGVPLQGGPEALAPAEQGLELSHYDEAANLQLKGPPQGVLPP